MGPGKAASAGQQAEVLDELFTAFDQLTKRHGLEKIKTIGDAYMVAGGLPDPRPDHAQAVADMALAMRDEVAGRTDPGGQPLQVRIGIDTGPVVAGVIGTTKFSYDLWGDTVNTASRMESLGCPAASRSPLGPTSGCGTATGSGGGDWWPLRVRARWSATSLSEELNDSTGAAAGLACGGRGTRRRRVGPG